MHEVVASSKREGCSRPSRSGQAVLAQALTSLSPFAIGDVDEKLVFPLSLSLPHRTLQMWATHTHARSLGRALGD